MATTASSTPGPRRFPVWAKIALGLLVFLLLLALALPYFLNVDRYRDTIANAIEAQTGRHVTLGKIRATFLPGVGFVVEDLHIGSPPGFPAGDVVSADAIRGNVAIGPLMHSIVHLNSLELVHPKLALISDNNGKNNYTFTSSAPAKDAQTAAKSGTSSGVSLDEIDSILLSSAEVSMGNIVKGKVEPSADVKGINVTMHNFVISPMNMHDWQGDSKLSGVTLSLAGWSAPIAFRSGQLQLAGGKLDAQFVADLAKASDLNGTLSVPDVVKPQVNFEVSSSDLDIDKLMAAVGGGSSTQSTPQAKPAEPPSGPSELVARGRINVAKITTKPYTVGPANIEMRVYTDRAELWPISIGMYGGTLQLSSRVDRKTDPPRFSATVAMRNLDVAKVLEVSPSARGKMGGIGELDLQLPSGALSEQWKKTLSGTGKFAVRNGFLPGVNLAGAAQSVAKMAGVGGNTPFTVLEGDIAIADQKVASKQIHLDSPDGTVDLRGSVSLDGALDYQGQVVVNPGAVAGAGAVGQIVGGLINSRVSKITVPIALGGTIESPKVQPGKGVPSFAGATSTTGAAPNSSAPGQPAAPENPVDTIRNLFKKH
jgi:AsmA protein